MTLPLEDYAVIGDLHTAAIVGTDGSIDWLCLPHFDSPACFARILGDTTHGFWQLAPVGGTSAITGQRRRYRDNSLVLETEFDTESGSVRITDCMPIRDSHPHVVRLVEGLSGTVGMHVDLDRALRLRRRLAVGDLVETASSALTTGPDPVAMWHQVDPSRPRPAHRGRLHREQGRALSLHLCLVPLDEEPPPPLDAYYAIGLTDAFWQDWAAQCTYEGPWRDEVSAIVDHAQRPSLTNQPVASCRSHHLPARDVGGNRNWDYRYCWLRDATLTLEALMRGGFFEEAMAWRDWLLWAVAGDVTTPDHVRPGR